MSNEGEALCTVALGTLACDPARGSSLGAHKKLIHSFKTAEMFLPSSKILTSQISSQQISNHLHLSNAKACSHLKHSPFIPNCLQQDTLQKTA